MKLILSSMLSAAIGVTAAGGAHSAVISGTVTSNGDPVRGALLTLVSADGLYSETVLTDKTGNYRLATEQMGALTLRARARANADKIIKIQIMARHASLKKPFSLTRLVTAQEISDSLPATAHLARVKFANPTTRQLFQLDCTECHQLGAPATLRTHTPAEWLAIMKVMVHNAEYTTDVHADEYAAAIQKAFDGTPTVDHENPVIDEAALGERVTEWKLPGALAAHDTNIYPPTGKFYSVDMFIDDLFVTDPKTNQTTQIPIPPLGVPVGGSFAGQSDVPAYVHEIRHGLHSLELGADGKFYMTGSIGGDIVVFDPATGKFQSYNIGSHALIPHTPRFDSKGILWFTLYLSNQVGRFDPKTGHTTVIQLPNKIYRKELVDRTMAVYGIDINPLDGSVWYTRLYANAIGRINPETLQVQEWDPPVFGPRRARFDAKGGFWIPGYADGRIARLDTTTMKYDIVTMPTLASDEVEAPYAVAVEPKSQDLWVTTNMSDRMFRYTPSTKTWAAFPMPTRGAITRDIVFTPDGKVCGVNNPWGVPTPGLVEGNMDSLICLKPNARESPQ
jgi:virginiamycin B lyase